MTAPLTFYEASPSSGIIRLPLEVGIITFETVLNYTFHKNTSNLTLLKYHLNAMTETTRILLKMYGLFPMFP